jgi:hypothetical protein
MAAIKVSEEGTYRNYSWKMIINLGNVVSGSDSLLPEKWLFYVLRIGVQMFVRGLHDHDL